ncbi:hypothetical protein ACUOFC_04930, partial [Escherichia sp. TWPC-MK]
MYTDSLPLVISLNGH